VSTPGLDAPADSGRLGMNRRLHQYMLREQRMWMRPSVSRGKL
jgi:hypothetical protein